MPLVHPCMPIHKVLSSARIMRLVAPGCPSLIATGFGTELVDGTIELLARSTTVRLPPNSVTPLTTFSGCWPTTYIVVESTRALLAPPAIATVVIGAAPLEQGAALHGSNPEFLPRVKISGPTGSTEYDEATPPHSGPQLST